MDYDGGKASSFSERDVQNHLTKISMLEQFNGELKRQLQESEEALQAARNENYELSKSKECHQNELAEKDEVCKRLQEEKLGLVELLDKKNTEVGQLKKIVDEFQQKSLATSDSNLSNDIKLKQIKLNFDEARLEKERNLYREEIGILNSQLEMKTAEVLKYQKDINLIRLESKMKIEEKSNEVRKLLLELNQLKSLMESKDNTIEEHLKKIYSLQKHYSQLEAISNKETEADSEIIDSLNRRNDELQEIIKAKDKNIEELETIVRKSYEAHNDLETRFNEMKESYMTDCKEFEEKQQELVEELDALRNIVNEKENRAIEHNFERFFPVAYENNRRCNNIVNLSELYQGYVQTKQDLEACITEKEQLENLVIELNKRLDEDAPVLYQNMQNYSSLSRDNEQLKTQVEQLQQEKMRLLSEKDNDSRLINSFNREIERFKAQNETLSTQITYLLQSLQEAKGFPISATADTSFNRIDQQDGGNNHVIPPGLLTFKDVQDLQAKNVELISLVKQLTAELDNKEESDEKTATYRAEINHLNTQIKKLEEELAKHTEASNHLINKKRISTNTTVDTDDYLDVLAENKELKSRVEKLNNEICTLREESLKERKQFDNEKSQLIQENANLKADLNKVDAEMKAREREIESIQLTIKACSEENQQLRERNILLNSNVENLEKNVIYLKSDIDSLKQSITSKDQAIQLVNSEKIILKNAQDNLLAENTRLTTELENTQRLLHSVHAIQDNFNVFENQNVQALNNQIDNLKRENQYFKEKAEKQEDKWRKAVSDFSARVHNLQNLLDKEKNNYIELQKQNFELQLKFQQQSDRLISNNTSNGLIETAATVSPGSIDKTDYKKQLQVASDEIKILKGKLSNLEASYENMKTINTTLETNLNQYIQNNSEVKNSFDVELTEKLERIEQLNNQLKLVQSEMKIIERQKNDELVKMQKSLELNGQEIDKLKKSLEQSQEATERALNNEQKLLDDLKIQSICLSNAQEDYKREIASRSQDSKTIFEQKLKIEDLQKQLLSKETECDKLAKQLANLRDSLESQRKVLEEENHNLKSRCEQLEQANDVLISQIELLQNKIISLENNSNLFMLDEEAQKTNAEQLLSIIAFLRQEKTQLQSQVSNMIDAELCLKVELENSKKEIENLKNNLVVEQQSVMRLNNMTEFNDLVAKAEMVQVLKETNNKMRLQIGQLEKRCNELAAKVAKYEAKENQVEQVLSTNEEEQAEKQVLKNQNEQLKAKVASLVQQIRGLDGESIRRLNNEKASLANKVQTCIAEASKIKQELATVQDDLTKANRELAFAKEDKTELQTRYLQLKNLARKYRADLNQYTSIEKHDKETQSYSLDVTEPLTVSGQVVTGDNDARLNELLVNLQEMKGLNNNLKADVDRLNQLNRNLQTLLNEKDANTKKMLTQCRLKITALNTALIAARQNQPTQQNQSSSVMQAIQQEPIFSTTTETSSINVFESSQPETYQQSFPSVSQETQETWSFVVDPSSSQMMVSSTDQQQQQVMEVAEVSTSQPSHSYQMTIAAFQSMPSTSAANLRNEGLQCEVGLNKRSYEQTSLVTTLDEPSSSNKKMRGDDTNNSEPLEEGEVRAEAYEGAEVEAEVAAAEASPHEVEPLEMEEGEYLNLPDTEAYEQQMPSPDSLSEDEEEVQHQEAESGEIEVFDLDDNEQENATEQEVSNVEDEGQDGDEEDEEEDEQESDNESNEVDELNEEDEEDENNIDDGEDDDDDGSDVDDDLQDQQAVVGNFRFNQPKKSIEVITIDDDDEDIEAVVDNEPDLLDEVSSTHSNQDRVDVTATSIQLTSVGSLSQLTPSQEQVSLADQPIEKQQSLVEKQHPETPKTQFQQFSLIQPQQKESPVQLQQQQPASSVQLQQQQPASSVQLQQQQTGPSMQLQQQLTPSIQLQQQQQQQQTPTIRLQQKQQAPPVKVQPQTTIQQPQQNVSISQSTPTAVSRTLITFLGEQQQASSSSAPASSSGGSRFQRKPIAWPVPIANPPQATQQQQQQFSHQPSSARPRFAPTSQQQQQNLGNPRPRGFSRPTRLRGRGRGGLNQRGSSRGGGY